MTKKVICATDLPVVQKDENLCTGRDLAEALRAADLSESEAKAWYRDLQSARR